MHASSILRRCLAPVLDPMHGARRKRLLTAVDALASGRRLSLTALARSWPDAEWMHAPMKALDRLLSNAHLHAEVGPLQKAMSVWLLRGTSNPIVLVDWADLKGDGRWAVLRASVPIGGRALTWFEQIFPLERMGQPQAQHEFLRAFARIVPDGVVPILVTDAGFRSDWLRAVRDLHWHYVSRVRNNTKVMSADDREWRPCSSLHTQVTAQARDLGAWQLVKGNPMPTRLVLARRRSKGRDQLTRSGQPQQSKLARKARKSAREPWLLATSLDAKACSAHAVVVAYGRRMQIEEAFRDLKSHRYGVGFEDCLTSKPERLAILLLLNAMASLAAWLMGLAAAAHVQNDPLTRQPKQRGRYSLLRRGFEWLRRAELPPEIVALLHLRDLQRLTLEAPANRG